jgi:hypothetical protein
MDPYERRRSMTLFTPRTAALLLGSALTAAMLATGPAAADSWRTDCLGNNCVRTHCDDSGEACTTSTNYTTRSAQTTTSWSDDGTWHRTDSYGAPAAYGPPVKPMRYACNYDGDDCHWTRSYFLDDGTPVFDPGMTP